MSTVRRLNLGILQATSAELVQQLATARRPAQGDSQEIRTLLSRAVNAEKRLVVANNQLLQHEEKISNLNQKTSTADTKWEARVKEYEARLKAAEEKYKRERQGSKERALELENQVKFVSLFFIAFSLELVSDTMRLFQESREAKRNSPEA